MTLTIKSFVGWLERWLLVAANWTLCPQASDLFYWSWPASTRFSSDTRLQFTNSQSCLSLKWGLLDWSKHIGHGSRVPAWKREKTRQRFDRDTPVFFRVKMTDASRSKRVFSHIFRLVAKNCVSYLPKVNDNTAILCLTCCLQRKDLLQLMIDASDSETHEGLEIEEIVTESVGFMLAGYETTSTALTFATYLLAANPEVQERLANEIHEYLELNPVSVFSTYPFALHIF